MSIPMDSVGAAEVRAPAADVGGREGVRSDCSRARSPLSLRLSTTSFLLLFAAFFFFFFACVVVFSMLRSAHHLCACWALPPALRPSLTRRP